MDTSTNIDIFYGSSFHFHMIQSLLRRSLLFTIYWCTVSDLLNTEQRRATDYCFFPIYDPKYSIWIVSPTHLPARYSNKGRPLLNFPSLPNRLIRVASQCAWCIWCTRHGKIDQPQCLGHTGERRREQQNEWEKEIWTLNNNPTHGKIKGKNKSATKQMKWDFPYEK